MSRRTTNTRSKPRRFLLNSPASQAVNGDEDGRPLKHLHQTVEKPFVVAMYRFKIFFKKLLGFTNA